MSQKAYVISSTNEIFDYFIATLCLNFVVLQSAQNKRSLECKGLCKNVDISLWLCHIIDVSIWGKR